MAGLACGILGQSCDGGCYWDSGHCVLKGYRWTGSSCEPGESQCSPYCTNPWNPDCVSVCTGIDFACCAGTRYGEPGAWCGMPGDWDSPSIVVLKG